VSLPINYSSWAGVGGSVAPPYLQKKISNQVRRCDRTTLEMRGLSPKIISGDSRCSKNTQTQHRKHTISKL
jgi:hypothetical protein